MLILLTALTQGPLMSMWVHRTTLVDADLEYAIATTYLAVHVPALLLLAKRGLPSRWLMPAQLSVLALVGWLALSTTWSAVSVQTKPAVVALLAPTLAGLYLARSFSGQQLLVKGLRWDAQ